MAAASELYMSLPGHSFFIKWSRVPLAHYHACCICILLYLALIWGTGSPCSPSYPWSHLHAFASQVLELTECTTMLAYIFILKTFIVAAFEILFLLTFQPSIVFYPSLTPQVHCPICVLLLGSTSMMLLPCKQLLGIHLTFLGSPSLWQPLPQISFLSWVPLPPFTAYK